MKRFVMAVVLTGIVAATTMAGNVPTSDFVQPPPPPPYTMLTLTDIVLTFMDLIR